MRVESCPQKRPNAISGEEGNEHKDLKDNKDAED